MEEYPPDALGTCRVETLAGGHLRHLAGEIFRSLLCRLCVLAGWRTRIVLATVSCLYNVPMREALLEEVSMGVGCFLFTELDLCHIVVDNTICT